MVLHKKFRLHRSREAFESAWWKDDGCGSDVIDYDMLLRGVLLVKDLNTFGGD
jgi:hypothetical protein